MSFHYQPINSNGMPTMLPLLTNLTNGNSFLPSLASNQAVTSAGLLAAAAAAAAAAHHSNGSENALDFNRNHQKLCSAPGAGPMDLETLNDDRESQRFLRSPTESELNLTSAASVQRKLTKNCDESTEKNFSTYNPCDVMYNMGIPSQNLMNIMQSNVMNIMRDTSSMVQTIPQFSLINHHQLPALQTTSTSTNNNTLSESTIAASSTVTSSSNNSAVAKETITCKSCILMPPNPNAPAPSTRERPKGCRTVFVGGLPENITEDIIREVFEPCGEITTLRLSKKNFCHIRFVFEASVDSAIYLSGYRIRINTQNDSTNCGRLHVDFAQARDDQYEYECKQRQLQREQRHRERVERDRLRPSSPPPVVHFSEHEASTISERLKQDETFFKAVQILITWLERGDCSKKNSNIFYSMIQSTNSHIRRLLNERTTFEDELNKAKEMHRKHMQSLSTQLSQIEKVFGAASHKKVWDHFTKAQRKNIDLWKKQSSEVHVPAESLESHDTDEMDMSDEEESATYSRYGKRYRRDSAKDLDTKRLDAAAYSKNSKEIMSDVKDQQLKVLQETIRNLQTLLLESKTKERDNLNQIQNLELQLKRLNAKELMQKPKINEDSDPDTDNSDSDKDVVCVDDVKQSTKVNSDSIKNLIKKCVQNNNDNIEIGNEARLIGLMSAFLVVYPFGASLDNISTYIRQVSIGIDYNVNDIETILRKYKNIFCEISMPSSAGDDTKTEEIKWKFIGFDAKQSKSNSVECD